MNTDIRKAIIPVAGLGTRFLPMSLALSKEFFPLADKPIIQYIVQEAKTSGIEEIIFVISPKQKAWLGEYISFNTEKRKQANNEFEKDFFKLMNNAVFGKTMENVKKQNSTTSNYRRRKC